MSGKSKEEIAFELVSKLKGVGVWGENNMQAILDMYAQCLEATSGLRSVGGKTPSALLLKESNTAPTKQAPAPRQAAPAQSTAPAQQTAVQQPQVRQQQQMVQQAYQQQQPPAAR